MKRILITLAALAVSGTVYAENLDSYASVLQDNPAPFIQYRDAPQAGLDAHGDVLLDQVSRSRIIHSTPGLEQDLSIGNANSSLFDSDPDNQF